MKSIKRPSAPSAVPYSFPLEYETYIGSSPDPDYDPIPQILPQLSVPPIVYKNPGVAYLMYLPRVTKTKYVAKCACSKWYNQLPDTPPPPLGRGLYPLRHIQI